ncbi:hypothetical protein HL658_24470 [Azospirillum sp. RWY-5-1]|uniref:DUF3592 domain-containing protein n=1 Tax=Azospirillum oleiclasticum TaxID=2735135 RepID=A0ABX2TG20_9PROT|nr:hypothetical protein [Azospirillum oleiclasticum]NYZ15709.1 hypothetical protein [Azospirillum oleiclasticum]NYZ21979.1 hypothetical protein [Azospirillum oleiclasticum]
MNRRSRIARGIAVAAVLAVSALCLGMSALLGWITVAAPRVTVAGMVLEKGLEYASSGRAGGWRLLLTVEGQPYVFTRQVGWFDSNEAMVEAVATGRPATLTVIGPEMEDEDAYDPDDRRVPIVSLVQDGATVFGALPMLGPRVFGLLILVVIGLGAGLAGLALMRRPRDVGPAPSP